MTPISAPSGEKDTLAPAHLFRSRLIEVMARVEKWAVIYLEARCVKQPHLFGDKLKAIRQIAAGNDDDLIGCLEAFQPYADLRSTICHATLTRPNSQLFCFRPAFATGVLRWRPVIISEAEMAEVVKEASKLSANIVRCHAGPVPASISPHTMRRPCGTKDPGTSPG